MGALYYFYNKFEQSFYHQSNELVKSSIQFNNNFYNLIENLIFNLFISLESSFIFLEVKICF